MQWVIDNWIWIVFGLAFIGMHMFGHGHGSHAKAAGKDEPAGHGGHSCCGGQGKQGKQGKCCGGSSKKNSESKPGSASEADSKIGSNTVDANPIARRRSF